MQYNSATIYNYNQFLVYGSDITTLVDSSKLCTLHSTLPTEIDGFSGRATEYFLSLVIISIAPSAKRASDTEVPDANLSEIYQTHTQQQEL